MTHIDLFEPREPTYRVDRADRWHVLLRDGTPVAQGSMDTIRLHGGYRLCIN